MSGSTSTIPKKKKDPLKESLCCDSDSEGSEAVGEITEFQPKYYDSNEKALRKKVKQLERKTKLVKLVPEKSHLKIYSNYIPLFLAAFGLVYGSFCSIFVYLFCVFLFPPLVGVSPVFGISGAFVIHSIGYCCWKERGDVEIKNYHDFANICGVLCFVDVIGFFVYILVTITVSCTVILALFALCLVGTCVFCWIMLIRCCINNNAVGA